MHRMYPCVLRSVLAGILMAALAACNGHGNKKTVTQEIKQDDKTVAVEKKTDTVAGIGLDNSATRPDTGAIVADSGEKIPVSCSEASRYDEDVDDSILVRTCFFKKLKSIATGTPDNKGRYSWEYAMYRMKNGMYVETAPTEIFNEKRTQLAELINQKIQAELKEASADPESKTCLEGIDIEKKYSLDELGINFDDDGFSFSVDFELGSYCLFISVVIVSLTYDEITPYLK